MVFADRWTLAQIKCDRLEGQPCKRCETAKEECIIPKRHFGRIYGSKNRKTLARDEANAGSSASSRAPETPYNKLQNSSDGFSLPLSIPSASYEPRDPLRTIAETEPFSEAGESAVVLKCGDWAMLTTDFLSIAQAMTMKAF